MLRCNACGPLENTVVGVLCERSVKMVRYRLEMGAEDQ